MQLSENKHIDGKRLIEYFGLELLKGKAGCPTIPERAVKSFTASICDSEIVDNETLGIAVGDWLVRMNVNGLTLKTAVAYFKSIRALYTKARKAGLVPETDVFAKRMDMLRDKGEMMWEQTISDEDCDRMMSLTKSTVGKDALPILAADMVVFSLLNCCKDMGSVFKYRYEDIDQPSDEILAIIERNKGRGNNRKYIFLLDQGNLTARQLAEKGDKLVRGYFARNMLPLKGSVDETLKCYWAHTAVRAGYAPHEIRACLSTLPPSLAVLDLCERVEIGISSLNDITTKVGTLFIDNPLRWFAFGLRHGVKFADLVVRMENQKKFQLPELFYPCEEIHRRTGKKRAKESKPILPGVVFMRTRRTEITGLLSRIGDMAWCYTTDGRRGNNYAAISTSSFRQFQRAINKFTSDYEVTALGEMTPRPGDRIVVLDGHFRNHEASIDAVEQLPHDNSVIYRFTLVSDNGAQWNIGVDARLTHHRPRS